MTGGGRDKAYGALQRLLRARLTSNEAWPTIRDWETEIPDDRAAALVVSAIVEHSLESAIAGHFVLDPSETRSFFSDTEDGPMSSFSVKIKLGHALGVYENIARRDLTWIKNIRNTFAHTSAHLRFDSPEVALACDKLKIPDHRTYGGLMGPRPTGPKERFAFSVRMLFLYLSNDFGNGPLRYKDSPTYQTLIL